MDRKSILIVVACIGLLVGWNVLVNKLYPPKPLPPQSTNVLATAQSPALTNATATSTSSVPALGALSTNVVRIVETNLPEETVVITNQSARYTFTTHGGGLKLIELTGVATSREKKSGHIPVLNAQAPSPALAILDGEAVQGNGIFRLTSSGNTVRAEKQLPNGLVIIKEFTPTSNYLVSATVRLENHSGQPLVLPETKWVIGTATPLTVDDAGLTEGVFWSNGSDNQDISGTWFANRKLGCIPGTPRTEYREGQNNVAWAAVHNQFFTLIAMPKEPGNQVFAHPIDLPSPGADEVRTNSRAVRNPKGYEAALVYPPTTLAASQTTQRDITLYAGPKEYQTLVSVSTQFNKNVDAVMGYTGFFGFFSKMLLLGMNGLHSMLSLPYGWCIIAITVIIKLLFWPLTAASTRSMKRMQALQPQMKAIADKYKDDPVKKNQKTMEFMKENKVNPIGGCLPMLLQMPVFIGFFYMIRSAIELRGATFLWVPDLSRPDTLFMIPGINFPFNLLPIIMGVTMFWQAQLTPPSPGMDPMQQKIMRYMPLMFMVFLYNYSSGLALYWTINNLLTILQTKLTRTQPLTPATAGPALTSPKKKH
ncbi:MAG TPA: membrane protein insertase YidC [Candidatus Paceibacterota bacterium]|nr:membrane protein insertase YidC [Candidatus Paceibacterota bacterium]